MKNLFLFIFVFIFSFIQAQKTTLSVRESAEYKDKVKSTDVLAIHTSDERLTGIVRESKKHLMFDVFDQSLTKQHSVLVDSHKKERYIGEAVYGNQIKVVTVFSPKAKERIVYCHTFNLKNGAHTKTKLFEANVAKKRKLFGNRQDRQTNFAISPSGNYFAMVTDNSFKDVNDYAVRVFDAKTLDLVYQKSYQKHKDKYFSHNDISVNDDAQVFVLGKLYKSGKKEKKKGAANYDFILNKVSKENNEELTVNLPELFIKNLNISILDNKLHLIGFYSEERTGRIKGGCNFVIDSGNFSVKNKKSYELPLDVYEDLFGEKRGSRKKKKGKELSNFYVDYIIEDSQGNTYLLAEEFYITQTYVSNGMGGGYWQTIYHYDDILILKFNATGSLEWGRSIFKRANVPSYNAFLKNDELHVLLNSGKNLLEKEDGRTKVSKGWFESTSLYDIVYNNSGEVVYSKVQDNKGKTFYLPYFGTYQNGEFIMMSSGRKKRQFMILQ
jgi:hypothetical protein